MKDVTLKGQIVDTLPGGKFKVLVNEDLVITAYISSKVRHYGGKLLLGDTVKVVTSPYDQTQGRIVKYKR